MGMCVEDAVHGEGGGKGEQEGGKAQVNSAGCFRVMAWRRRKGRLGKAREWKEGKARQGRRRARPAVSACECECEVVSSASPLLHSRIDDGWMEGWMGRHLEPRSSRQRGQCGMSSSSNLRSPLNSLRKSALDHETRGRATVG